jgi:hypothetical protein
MRRDVDVHLVHRAHSVRRNRLRRGKTGTRGDKDIRAIVIGEAFRHRTAARIADANE